MIDVAVSRRQSWRSSVSRSLLPLTQVSFALNVGLFCIAGRAGEAEVARHRHARPRLRAAAGLSPSFALSYAGCQHSRDRFSLLPLRPPARSGRGGAPPPPPTRPPFLCLLQVSGLPPCFSSLFLAHACALAISLPASLQSPADLEVARVRLLKRTRLLPRHTPTPTQQPPNPKPQTLHAPAP
jgi:hypothetical protein